MRDFGDDFEELAAVDEVLLGDDGPELGGECQVCGCTDERGCPSGCIWATPAADLCSRCARET